MASANFNCSLCRQEIRAFYQSDPLRLLQGVVTRCGHIFHRRCLEDYVKRRLGEANGFDSLDHRCQVHCPVCPAKVTLESSVPLNSDGPFEIPATVNRLESLRIPIRVAETVTTAQRDEVSSLHERIQALQDENGTQKILIVHGQAQLEYLSTELEEFKADLMAIISRMDRILTVTGKRPEVGGVVNGDSNAGQNSTTVRTQNFPGPISGHEQLENDLAAPAPASSPTESTATMHSTTSRNRSNGSISISTANHSFHTAAGTSSSTASSGNRSTMSSPSFRSGHSREMPGRMPSSFRQSCPSLHERPLGRRRRTVWQYVSNFIYPGGNVDRVKRT